MPAEGAVQSAAAAVGFEDAVAGFLDSLSSYRGYSVHTVKAYAREAGSGVQPSGQSGLSQNQ